MANSIRGRAVRLLDNFINQTSVLSTRNISRSLSENSIRGDYQGCQSSVLLTSETRGRARTSYRRLSSAGRALRQVQEPGRQTSPVTPAHRVSLVESDLRHMFDDIKKELESQFELKEIAKYYFDGQGKAVRPLITVLMSRAINTHLHDEDRLFNSQWQVAKVTEMLHTASLVHDDVLDASDTRRGKPSVNNLYGQRKAVMAGDYILSVASTMLARIRNEEVIVVLSQVMSDLVQGEFMQLGSKENENERFAHYLKKTFKKTASLIAYSCKAVAILSGADDSLQEVAFQYGRNVGIAFQLVDDLLDFVSSSSTMGKPTAADLKLGLATAPVLFACEKFPELNPMIMRRFQEPGDVQKAFELVHKSDGLEQTQFLARQHCQEAIKVISTLKPSEEQKALITITDKVLNRIK
ncbi:all trans-polyprenyl-diphosphate synthase PDSS1-like [Portunus trituberculatus]|uniref:all trans-polyprenyl-diphosphate synthase PDSS1-like n=1 Tax=Portunus trituberculatus TaxID=210409 RepID=UPI001E1CE7A2|nr:all trans-polyprenyl-diphosphate synthase PDSS1-like [Portunus trituberculatus]